MEVGYLLSGYFKVLCDSHFNLQLRMLSEFMTSLSVALTSVVGVISDMLVVSNRPGLQMTFMVEGFMQTMLQLINDSKVTSQSSLKTSK